MELKYVNVFPEVTVDEFEDLLASEDFNSKLEKLPNVSKRTLLEEKDLGNGKRRTVVKYESSKVPEAAKKFLGDGDFGWTEEVDFDRNTHFHKIKIIPSKMKDRLQAEGTYKLEPAPGGGCKRIVTLNIKIKIFGLGSVIEKTAKPFIDANSHAEEKIAREYIKENLAKIKKKG